MPQITDEPRASSYIGVFPKEKKTHSTQQLFTAHCHTEVPHPKRPPPPAPGTYRLGTGRKYIEKS